MEFLKLECPFCLQSEGEHTHAAFQLGAQDGQILSIEGLCKSCKEMFRITFDASGQLVSHIGEKNPPPPEPIRRDIYREFALSGRLSYFLFRRFERNLKVDTTVGAVQQMIRDGYHPMHSDARCDFGTGVLAKMAGEELQADLRQRELERLAAERLRKLRATWVYRKTLGRWL